MNYSAHRKWLALALGLVVVAALAAGIISLRSRRSSSPAQPGSATRAPGPAPARSPGRAGAEQAAGAASNPVTAAVAAFATNAVPPSIGQPATPSATTLGQMQNPATSNRSGTNVPAAARPAPVAGSKAVDPVLHRERSVLLEKTGGRSNGQPSTP